MLKILVAPNGFKESLSATEAARAITAGLRRASRHLTITEAPLADGGSGTVAALARAARGRIVRTLAKDARGRAISAHYALLDNGATAVIELASAAGLAQLSVKDRNPLKTTSYGVGQMIASALRRSARRIIIGIGDSATVDGGIGALQALGVRLLDARGRSIGAGGGALKEIAKIDTSAVDERLYNSEILIASDVENRLLGREGAAYVFGPQKGATPAMVAALDAGLAHWAQILEASTGRAVAERAGSGAAGGFATGFLALFGARLTSGSALVFNYCGMNEKIAEADLIFTGEGAIDEQTLRGKTPARLARAAKKAGVPIIALAGRVTVDAQSLRRAGFSAALPIVDRPMTLAQARAQGASLLAEAAARALRLILIEPQRHRGERGIR